MAGLEKMRDLVLDAERSAEAVLHITDVSMESEVKAMVRKCGERFGHVACEMNNVGIAKGGSRTTETSLETCDRMASVNEKGMSRAPRASSWYRAASD